MQVIYGAESNRSLHEDKHHCIWYGECSKTATGKPLNCYWNETARPLDDNAATALLAKHCPHMVVDRGDGLRTCCDINNLKSLADGLGLAANLLKRCPSCFDNFARVICEMTCSPMQSKFLEVVSTNTNPQTGNF